MIPYLIFRFLACLEASDGLILEVHLKKLKFRIQRRSILHKPKIELKNADGVILKICATTDK